MEWSGGVVCCGVVLCGVVWCGVVWCGVVVWCVVWSGGVESSGVVWCSTHVVRTSLLKGVKKLDIMNWIH